MGYSNILVAVDLSEESVQVLKRAQQIADNNNASLHLLTVIKPLTQVYGGLDMAPIASGAVSFEEEAMKQAQDQLGDLATRFQIKPDHVHVVLGSPTHEIREMATGLRTDLIIVGSHGRHGLGRILGSTANGILHGAKCDVLAVRVDHPE
ncbi:MAG: universal stress protein [Pseudomonadales bacterium]|nr:universal stress protein [Pseudomonadales bacterium]